MALLLCRHPSQCSLIDQALKGQTRSPLLPASYDLHLPKSANKAIRIQKKAFESAFLNGTGHQPVQFIVDRSRSVLASRRARQPTRCQTLGIQHTTSYKSAAAASATASSPAFALSLARPGVLDTAPVKARLTTPTPSGAGGLSHDKPWGLPSPWSSSSSSSTSGSLSSPLSRSPVPRLNEDDPRRTIVRSAPRTPAAELSTAAQMARLSSLVYYPDPSSRLEALGLELKECRQTPYTAFFVADGPDDLFDLPAWLKPDGGKRKKEQGKGGKTRYIITRGVAFDREEVKWTDLWMKLLHFWPVEFERGLTPQGVELMVHGGVQEIAEHVYDSLLPFLAFDAKRDGITSVRFAGHSLGGSLAVLLMLMFHLRSPVKRGYATDIDFGSHTFGSFPVLASPFEMPWGEQREGDVASPCALMQAISIIQRQLKADTTLSHTDASNTIGSCNVLRKLGLPDVSAQSFVSDSDIVPRAFLALKHDAVKALLQVKDRFLAPAGGPRRAGWGAESLGFQPVGLFNFMESQGEQVSVARLHSRLADQVLHMDVGDFIRNPSLLGKSIQDHYFNGYVAGLESALAAARLEALGN